jgi:tRNA-guanine family transglycosylase
MDNRSRKEHFRPPIVWLGQSADTSSICSQYSDLTSAPFLTSLGCAIRKPSLKITHFNERLKTKLGIAGPLMVDSGGFALSLAPHSNWTWRQVAQQIAKIDADIFVSLDHPPNVSDTMRERTKKIVASMENFARLSEEFRNKIIMPVIHGRTVKEIKLSLKILANHGQNFGWVGLGGIVPLLQHRRVSSEISKMTPEVFIGQALYLIRERFPKSIIHVFGAGGTRTFPAVYALGADSGDSIGWRQAAGFGSIFLPYQSQRAIKWDLERGPPRKTLSKSDLSQLRLCKCPVCKTKSGLASKLRSFERSFHFRSIHNAWTVANQSAFWPKERSDLRLEVAAGKLGQAWAIAARLACSV